VSGASVTGPAAGGAVGTLAVTTTAVAAMVTARSAAAMFLGVRGHDSLAAWRRLDT
jgi:hypothetical protein